MITGSAGLIGSAASRYFAGLGLNVVGIDNDMRSVFFGEEASTAWQRKLLERDLGAKYHHMEADVRDGITIDTIFKKYGHEVELVIHTAAQPSHDWAAREPITDFAINAIGTLNLLEATRKHSPDSVCIVTSTLHQLIKSMATCRTVCRWSSGKDDGRSHPGTPTVTASARTWRSTRRCTASSALRRWRLDVLVQEYGRYFQMKTVCFRCGCLTGPNHSGTQLHGFLAYLMKCNVKGAPYTVFGYRGKQVRDNIHSNDLIRAFHEFFKAPRRGEVYNMDYAEPLNLGQDRLVSINQLADLVATAAGIQMCKRHVPGPQGVRGRNSNNAAS